MKHNQNDVTQFKFIAYKWTIFFILFLGIGGGVYKAHAKKETNAFEVVLWDDRITVHSPDPSTVSPSQERYQIIFINKTMTKVIGRLEQISQKGAPSDRIIVVKAGQSVVEVLPSEFKGQAVFVPLIPAFQELPLKLGSGFYEIPSKK